MIDYYLNEKAGDVKLEILNVEGKVIRTFSSSDKPYKIPELNIPLYWIRPQQILSADAGHHRFLWDMHYTPLDLDVSFPMSAIYQNTAPNPTSPWVMPGEYSARLTVNGQSQTQKFTVKMDPRVTTTLAQLKEQHDLSVMCYDARKAALDALNTISKFESQLNAIKNPAVAKAVAEFKTKLTAVKGSEGFRRDNTASWNSVDRTSDQLFGLLQEADMPVTAQAKQAMLDQERTYLKTNEAWKSFLKVDLPAFNKTLKAKGEKELK